MAVVNTKSTTVTNYDAQPRILTSGYLAGGGDCICTATAALVSTDNIGSTYRFGFLPSGVLIEDIQLLCDASTAGAFQMGVYANTQQPCTTVTAGVSTTAAPGAVPVTSANLIFGAGISTASAVANWKSVYSPAVLAGGFAAASAGKRVWELLGLDADPFYEFHLVMTATTAPTANANVTLRYSFVR